MARDVPITSETKEWLQSEPRYNLGTCPHKFCMGCNAPQKIHIVRTCDSEAQCDEVLATALSGRDGELLMGGEPLPGAASNADDNITCIMIIISNNIKIVQVSKSK